MLRYLCKQQHKGLSLHFVKIALMIFIRPLENTPGNYKHKEG
ncbi:hypothetical protein [uncultured Gammaproteobacteria bacterium]|nr:hypothetical protein [uncultured Gammaproteobacteria bacterium]SHN89576.1 hypothetical protein BCLUESOX_1439 [bacterium endosymbiont of Bathymodiolus sp. 5 South]VVH58560.1 hypothetical protein BSPCLSOX_2273 [uncultured Gammaproteobacteria bacterium]VVH62274.1 hypothetical protein BSPWISOX_2293 [uncultured Gammaproteobacteria bacterium]